MKTCVLLVISVVCAWAQNDPVFRSGVSLVRVDAEAVDGTGHTVAGLTKDDFRVLDEGAQQTLVNFGFDVEPLDLILLFDTSSGMHGKLMNIVRATELGFNELHPGDRVSVRSFSNFSTEYLPFTDDLQAVNVSILTQVIRTPFAGAPRLEQAAEEAAQRFRQEVKTRRKRAVLAITGRPALREANEAAVVRDFWASDAILSQLILGQGGPNAIVDQTGGAVMSAQGDPGAAFRESVHYLRSGYTMYYAQAEGVRGSERKLTVELTPEAAQRHPNVKVHARSGYLVP